MQFRDDYVSAIFRDAGQKWHQKTAVGIIIVQSVLKSETLW
jgi:hypothetical protein